MGLDLEKTMPTKKILIGAVLVLMTLSGCSDEREAKRCLEAAGYTKINTTGWAPLSCSEDDTFSTGFTAINARGDRVEGVVCSSLVLKGCTVRH